LPDLSADEAPGILREKLQAALGVTLPADFGTIRLMKADRLAAAQTAIRVFDIVVVALIVLSVVLVALALYLARDRRRMVVYLGIGTIIAFLIARAAIRGAEGLLVGGIDDAGVAGGVRAVMDATVADLRGLTTIVLIATVVLVVAAYLWGRPAWIGRTADTVREGDVEETVRTHRTFVERGGLLVIGFVIVWLALGFEIALIGAALVGAWLLAVRAFSTPPEDAAGA
jgi:hypothetical protein